MQEYTVTAKVVMLAASACESARLLLNSKSSRNPNGLANASGVVGKYLHDSTGADMGGILPNLSDENATMKMVSAECMYTHRGGLTIKNLIFRGDIISNIMEEWECPVMDLVLGCREQMENTPAVMESKKKPADMVLH